MIVELSTSEYAATCFAYSMELLGSILLVCVSLAVLRAVFRCSVIHCNLRLLLAFKCVASIIHGCDRATFILGQFRAGFFELSAPAWINFFSQISGGVNVHLCVAYTAERIYATVCVKTYEKKRPYFGCICVVLMLLLTTYNSGSDNLWRSSSTPSGSSYGFTTYLSNYVVNSIIWVCIAVIFYIMKYNFKSYKQQLRGGKVGALTERYQSSENVRTTRQLMPVIFLHAMIGLVGAVYLTLALFSPSTRMRFLQRIIMFLTYSVLYNLCQVAMLYFHPALRKEAVGWLRRTLGDTNRCRARVVPRRAHVERLSGGQLIEAPVVESEVYFTSLADAWDQHYEARSGRIR